MKFAERFTVTRRKLLENGKWIGSLLVAGFVGGIPWRVFDFIKSRRNAPKSVRLSATGDSVIGGSATLTVTKGVGSTDALSDSLPPSR